VVEAGVLRDPGELGSSERTSALPFVRGGDREIYARLLQRRPRPAAGRRLGGEWQRGDPQHRGLGIGIFSLGGGSVLTDNAVKSNGTGGIESDGTELVSNNAVRSNPDHNIQLGGLVSGNLVFSTGGIGVHSTTTSCASTRRCVAARPCKPA